MGTLRDQWRRLPDLRPTLHVPVTLLVTALLCYGFFPQSFVRIVAPTFGTFLSANADVQGCSHGVVRGLHVISVNEENAQQRRGYSIR